MAITAWRVRVAPQHCYPMHRDEEKVREAAKTGHFSFATKSKNIPQGGVVSATATNQSTGDTSEFSNAVSVS